MAQHVNARIQAYLIANLSNPKLLAPNLARWVAVTSITATNRFILLMKNAAGS